MFLQKVTLQIGPKKLLGLKKVRILCLGHMLLMILTRKKLLELSIKKGLQKTRVKNWKSS